MKKDKFLIGLLIGIGVIIIAAVGLFLARRGGGGYVTDDTPEGVVRNYIIALQKGDLDRAYGYLLEGEQKPTQANFALYVNQNKDWILEQAVNLQPASIQGTSARVMLNFSAAGLDSGGRGGEEAVLSLQDGQWKLVSVPYPFWSYDWYQVYAK